MNSAYSAPLVFSPSSSRTLPGVAVPTYHASAFAPLSTCGKAERAGDYMAAAATIGALAAGVALFEIAVPALALGGAAILAPKYLPRFLPKSLAESLLKLPGQPRRRSKPFAKAIAATRPPVTLAAHRANAAAQRIVPANPAFKKLALKQAVAKTITFRIIVTSLDFTVNYLVIGELATAAGLSAFTLVVGPFFYFLHETLWNYFGRPVDAGLWGARVEIPMLPFEAEFAKPNRRKLTINRPLAKTITFRTFATTMDFTVNYLVVGDLATAAGLSAFGFVLGPFVYWGHEAAWDRFTSPKAQSLLIDGPAGQANSSRLNRV